MGNSKEDIKQIIGFLLLLLGAIMFLMFFKNLILVGFTGLTILLLGAFILPYTFNIIQRNINYIFTSKNKWVISISGLLLIIVLISIGGKDTESIDNNITNSFSTNNDNLAKSQIENTSDTNKKEQEVIKPSPIIFESVKEFKSKFNQFTEQNNFTIKIRNIDLSERDVRNTFIYMFNDNIGIWGVCNKSDNSVISITMIGQGEGTPQSGLNIMIIIASMISSVDDSLLPEERGAILTNMIGSMKQDGLSKKTIKNGIKYWSLYSDYSGFSFGIQSANL